MESNSKTEPLLNTTLGLIPWVLFIFIQNLFSYQVALSSGFVAWVLFMFYYIKVRRTKTIQILLYVSGAALAIQALGLLIKIPELYTIIFSEFVLLALLGLFIYLKRIINRNILKEKSTLTNQSKSMALTELYYVTYICRNVLFVHFSIALLYFIVPFQTVSLDNFVYKQMGIILITLVIVYEHVRLSMIKQKLSSEEWLPVVNEAGRVIGKIAQSVSFSSGNKYLHPIVRIALIYKGMLYLMQRPSYHLMNPEVTDHPFEKYVSFNQNLDDAASEIIQSLANAQGLHTRFLLKYIHKSITVNRLVYLYALPVHDEDTMTKIQLTNGKVWTEKQIEENLDKAVFSECFEKEYDTIKNTVLLAEKLFIQQEDAGFLG